MQVERRNLQLLAYNTQLPCYTFSISFRFENFKVYQDAKKLHTTTLKVTLKFPREYHYLGDQMKRAALSVLLNIAEGSGKKSDRDFHRYIQNSLGSIHELAAEYDVARSEKLVSDKTYHEAVLFLHDVRNQLGGFAKTLSVVG